MNLSTIQGIIDYEVKAGHRKPIKYVYDAMRAINEVSIANGGEPLTPEQDIRFSQFMEEVVENQREKDLIYVSHFFHKAYITLFITIQVLREVPSPASIDEVQNVYKALTRLGYSDLISNGLDENVFETYLRGIV